MVPAYSWLLTSASPSNKKSLYFLRTFELEGGSLLNERHNDSITHSLRALLARYSRTTCRVSLHCRLNVFLFVLCSKSKNIPGRNKKIPEDFAFWKVFGERIYRIKKVSSRFSYRISVSTRCFIPHPETDGLKVISAASLVNFKV